MTSGNGELSSLLCEGMIFQEGLSVGGTEENQTDFLNSSIHSEKLLNGRRRDARGFIQRIAVDACRNRRERNRLESVVCRES